MQTHLNLFIKIWEHRPLFLGHHFIATIGTLWIMFMMVPQLRWTGGKITWPSALILPGFEWNLRKEVGPDLPIYESCHNPRPESKPMGVNEPSTCSPSLNFGQAALGTRKYALLSQVDEPSNTRRWNFENVLIWSCSTQISFFLKKTKTHAQIKQTSFD